MRSITPMMVKGTFLMRITWPSGSSSPKRFCATVWPTIATLEAPSTSSRVSERPALTSQSRAGRYSGVTPRMVVDQLRLE